MLNETEIVNILRDMISNTYRARKAMFNGNTDAVYTNYDAQHSMDKIINILKPIRKMVPSLTEPNSGCTFNRT